MESAFSENSDKIRRLQYYIIVNFFAEKYDKDDKESLECEKCQGFDFEICRSYALEKFKDRNKSIVEYNEKMEQLKKDKDRAIENQDKEKYDKLSDCEKSTFDDYYEVEKDESTIPVVQILMRFVGF